MRRAVRAGPTKRMLRYIFIIAKRKRRGEVGLYVLYCTLFWDPVRAVHVAAYGLMSVQRKTERCPPKIFQKVIHKCSLRRGREGEGELHALELEVPIICARKVETTPVPDLNIRGKGQRLDGDGVENTI